MKTTPLDLEGNRHRILDALRDSRLDRSAIVLFPELCVTGYGCGDAFYETHLWKDAFQSVVKILPYTDGKIVVLGIPVFFSPHLYNCAVVISDSKIIGFTPKVYPANRGPFLENRWFREGHTGYEFYSLPEANIPFGNILFQTDDFTFGIEVGDNFRINRKPSSGFAEKGADFVLSMMAAPYFQNSGFEIIRHIQEASYREKNIYIYSNLAGCESGEFVYSGGCAISHNGKILSKGRTGFVEDYDIISAIVDLDEIKQEKAKYYRENRARTENEPVIVFKDFNIPEINDAFSPPIIPTLPNEFSEFTEIITLGLFDILIKSEKTGFSVCIDGGPGSLAILVILNILKERIKFSFTGRFWEKYKLTEKDLIFSFFMHNPGTDEWIRNLFRELCKELLIESYEPDIIKFNSQLMAENELISGKKFYEIYAPEVEYVHSPIFNLYSRENNKLPIYSFDRTDIFHGDIPDHSTLYSVAPIASVSKKFILDWITHIADGKDRRFLQTTYLKRYLEKYYIRDKQSNFSIKQESKNRILLSESVEKEYLLNGKTAKEIFELCKEEFHEYSELELMRFIEKWISNFKKSSFKRKGLPLHFRFEPNGLPEIKYPYFFGR